ncbi:hypothetical protein TNCT_735461 [Trichonephila clavata]|uniref:Uncharacterized protein n=1 Tax=Trichonephila clavata TaxID=2740835 RepID=A0A8X6HJN4_TRICU|nr:hypothetical protein TNCT_735461 [Trichonephila clavata]
MYHSISERASFRDGVVKEDNNDTTYQNETHYCIEKEWFRTVNILPAWRRIPCEGVLKVMTTMGCLVGRETHNYLQKRDETRIVHSERRTSKAVKQERINTKAELSLLKKFQEKEEGVLYVPDISD